MSRKSGVRALARVIREFGPGAAVLQQPPLPRTSRERVGHRTEVADRISTCTACDLRERCDHPMTPIWHSYRADRESAVAVIRAHPSWEEERFGELGVGPAARMIQSELGGVHATWLNAVQCTPVNKERGGSRTDDPSQAHIDTCRQHVLDALDAADVTYVLLFGTQATGLWRKDLLMRDVAGRIFLWNQRWLVMPHYDPKYLMRSDAVVSQLTWRRQMATFREIVHGQHSLGALHNRCLACNEPLFGYDEDGVPWCETHFEGGAMGAAKPSKKKQRNPNQGMLL